MIIDAADVASSSEIARVIVAGSDDKPRLSPVALFVAWLGLTSAITQQVIDAGSVNTAYTIDLTNYHETYLYLTLTANVTLTISGAAVGKRLYVEVIQGGAGSFTLTWPASVVWPSGASPSWNTTAGAVNTFALVYGKASKFQGNSAKY